MVIGFKRSVSSPAIPAGNYIVIMLATVTFAIQMLGDPNQKYLNSFILKNLTLSSMFGYMWLHMSMMHIVGNLITLWIFGRHVSLKISDASYVLSFILLGVGAAAVHFYYDGRSTIGASGAIMGILGMHVVLCYRQFGILGPWLILLWFMLNLTAGIIGNYPTTYMAHAGGFLTGMVLATLMIMLNIAKCDDAGLSLLKIIKPSLYRETIYKNLNFMAGRATLINENIKLSNNIQFKVETVKSGKQAQHTKSPIFR